MAFRIGVRVQQRQPDGSLVNIEIEGPATKVVGTREQIAKMLLEAEMKGNTGKARVHISLGYLQ